MVALLFMELFVGIAVEAFNSQKDLVTGNSYLKRTQRVFINVHTMAMDAAPEFKLVANGQSRIRDLCINISESAGFERFVTFCILGNTLILCLNWYMQPETFDLPFNILNYTFIVLFAIEITIKIIAKKGRFFNESWNIFDFIVALLTAVLITVSLCSSKDLKSIATILRILRICRLLRLLRRLEQLNTIFQTVCRVAPTMSSLLTLFMLFLFMFSIIAV